MSKTNAVAVKNAKKDKKLYLYPNAEDSQAAFYIIQELQNQNKIPKCEIVFVDDKESQSSLEFLKHEIAKSGELWIFHQEQKIYHKLCKNAAYLPIVSGIERLQKILCVTIEQIDQKEIEKNSMNNTFKLLNYASYFLLHFWISLDEQSAFVQTMKQLSQKINAYFAAHFNIEPYTIGIVCSHFSNGKHLGEVGEILEAMGQKINYVVNDKETLQNLPSYKQKKAICFPLQNSYMGVCLNLFSFYVTCQMPLTAPNWGQKMIYVSHAYIDPIAALIQRNRPLDDFWFSKKMGIHGYRMIPSLSNYSIFKDKFEELGHQDELVCAGYPSLDNYIAEYHQFPITTTSRGGGILVAINEANNIAILKEIFNRLAKQHETGESFVQKIILRPHPSIYKSAMFQELVQEFSSYEWFIYDTSKRLSAETMHTCFCLIGDHSSLVYTFPLCTLKPAILLIPNISSIQNTYRGISFYNPILHFYAQNVTECLRALETIWSENHHIRAQKIQDYRQKEVFNLGHASAFIAQFILQKLQEMQQF